MERHRGRKKGEKEGEEETEGKRPSQKGPRGKVRGKETEGRYSIAGKRQRGGRGEKEEAKKERGRYTGARV